MAQAALGKQGRICYVKNVTRTGSAITATGDLFVKDLATGEEYQVTNFVGTDQVILNPAFTASGNELVFTSNAAAAGGTTTYRVYMVAVDYFTSPEVGVILGDTTNNYVTASLSPDGKLIVAAMQTGTVSRLIVYDTVTKVKSLIRTEVGMTYSDPVFLDGTATVGSSLIVYKGTKSGIENIYRCTIGGANEVNLTQNAAATVRYGRIVSAVKGEQPAIVYSKQTKSGMVWSQWDVYHAMADGVAGSLPGTEVNVTRTPNVNEYDPGFYGDNAITRDVPISGNTTGTAGNVLYAAPVLGTDINIWLANYDTDGESNTQMSEMTGDTGEEGLVAWGPAPATDSGRITPTIGQTRIVYINNNEIWRSDWTDDGLLPSGEVHRRQLTSSGTNKYHVSLNANGANIVYDQPQNITTIPEVVAIMGSNGTTPSVVSEVGIPNPLAGIGGDYSQARTPCGTPDGKWVLYVKSLSGENVLYAKRIVGTGTPGGETQVITPGIATTLDLYDPAVAPDMNQIVFSNYDLDSSKHVIWGIGADFNWQTQTVNTLAAAYRMAGNTENPMWSDRYPSYNVDGSRIVFVSDRDGVNKIYTMDAKTGTDVVLFGGGNINYATYQNPTYPVYSPVGDGNIAFVATVGGIRQVVWSTPDGAVTPTNIGTAPGDDLRDEISWGIRRDSGTMTGIRFLQGRVPPGATVVYRVTVDVDELNIPAGYVLNEVVPDDWTVNTVWVDGTLTGNYAEYANTPVTGSKTVKMTFVTGVSGVAGNVNDHVVEISVTTGATTGDKKTVSGELVYINPVSGQNTVTKVMGNGKVLLANPYIPTDYYDADGNIRNDLDNAVIEDEDLLYTINEWKYNRQVKGGVGPLWPMNTDNWDPILIEVIGLWASNTFQGAYQYGGGTPAIEFYWSGVTTPQQP